MARTTATPTPQETEDAKASLDSAMFADWDAWLEEEMEEQDGGVPSRPFAVDTDAKADWALMRMGDLDRRMAAVDAMAAMQIQQIKAWQAKEVARLQRTRDRLEGFTTAYHVAVLQTDPGRKPQSISLPHGTLKVRKAQPQWTYEDEAVLAWAHAAMEELTDEKAGAVIRVKEEVDRNALKEYFKDSPVTEAMKSVVEGSSIPINLVTPDGEMLGEITVTAPYRVFSAAPKTSDDDPGRPDAFTAAVREEQERHG